MISIKIEDDFDEKDFTQTLQTVAFKKKLRKQALGVILPRHWVTVRVLKFPTADLSELKGMVEIEAEGILPFGRDEIEIRWRILELVENQQSVVMIAIVSRNKLQSLLDAFRTAGFCLEKIFFSSDCFLKGLALEGDYLKDSTPKLLFRFHQRYLYLEFVEKGQILWSRCTVLKDALEKRQWQEEVKRSLEALERLFSMRAKTSVSIFSCPESEKENIQAPLRELGFSKVTYVADPIRIECSGASSLGVSGEEGKSFDFLPESERVYRRHQKLKRLLIDTAVLWAVVGLLAAGVCYQHLDFKKRYLALLNNEIKTTSLEVGTGVFDQAPVVDLLKTLRELTPPGITLSFFNYEKNSHVFISATADQTDKVFRLMEALEHSKVFKQVTLQSISNSPSESAGAVFFEMEVKI